MDKGICSRTLTLSQIIDEKTVKKQARNKK